MTWFSKFPSRFFVLPGVFLFLFSLGVNSVAAGKFDPGSLPENLKSIEVNGVPIVYSDEGEGDPLIIFTPYPFGLGLWSGLVDKLKGEFRVIAVEPPGLRDPKAMEGDFSTEHFLKLYRQFIKDLKFRKAHILGFGETGAIVLGFGHHYPENTGSVISINGFEAVGWSEAFGATLDLLHNSSSGGLKTLMMMGTKKLPSEEEMKRLVPDLNKKQKEAVDSRFAAFTSDIKIGYILMMLPNHNRPTLLVRSETDGVLTEDFTSRTRRVIRKAPLRLKKLPDAGHFAFLDQPDEVAGLILTFLSNHPLKTSE